jgi:hypothetical protein
MTKIPTSILTSLETWQIIMWMVRKHTIDFYLDKVESLHTLSACSALPFTATAVDEKHLEHVAAMADLVQHHTK